MAENLEFVKVGGADGPQLNTDALKSAAHAFLNKGTTPAASPNPTSPGGEQPSTATVKTSSIEPASPSTQVPVTVTEGEQPAADNGQAPQEKSVEQQILELPDDAMIRLKVGGETVVMKAGEAKAQMMRGAHFTREMQKLRQAEEQFASRLSDAEKLETVISNDEVLAEYIMKAKPHLVDELAKRAGITRADAAQAMAESARTGQPVAQTVQNQPSFNPGELATLGEAEQLFQARAQALRQEVREEVLREVRSQLGDPTATVDQIVEQRVNAAIQRLEDTRQISAFDQQISSTIHSILEANPVLKAIPRVEQVLRFETWALKPRTPQEMLAAIPEVAKGIVDDLDQTYNTARKTAVIDKETMVKTGVEPPTGSQPSQLARPIDYRDETGKVSWEKIRAAAKAAIASRP